MPIADAMRRTGSARWSGRVAPLIARLALAAGVLSVAAHAQAPLPGAQRIEFEVATASGAMQKIFAHAFTPERAPRLPGIVILHGPEGLSDAREGFWGRELAALGMVARRWTASRRAA